jgi:hypothetical protein
MSGDPKKPTSLVGLSQKSRFSVPAELYCSLRRSIHETVLANNSILGIAGEKVGRNQSIEICILYNIMFWSEHAVDLTLYSSATDCIH